MGVTGENGTIRRLPRRDVAGNQWESAPRGVLANREAVRHASPEAAVQHAIERQGLRFGQFRAGMPRQPIEENWSRFDAERERALRMLEGVRRGTVDLASLRGEEIERLRNNGASWLLDAEASPGEHADRIQRVRAGMASLPPLDRNLKEAGLWDEMKHPRARGGKFRSKGGMVEPKGRGGKRLKVPERVQPVHLDPLQQEWDDLDRESQEYTGRPRASRAKEIIARQIDLVGQMHSPQSPGISRDAHDLVVVGTGPGGLTAATYGGSEGLDTVVLDASREGGGQARLSSRIENLIPFPAGIKGRELMKRSMQTTRRFAAVKLGAAVVGMDFDPESGIKTLRLADGSVVKARAVIIGTGVKLRRKDFPGSESKDVVYGDAREINRRCHGGDVVIVGGGNSGAQAALDIARKSGRVTILLRSGTLAKNTSDYLVGQIDSAPNITVENGEIAKANLTKDKRVSSVTLKDGREIPAKAIGMFIGAMPQVEWTGADVEKDERGFVRVGGEGRGTLETSIPGVYAIGDARSGSGRKVAAAIGDGGMAVTQMHGYISELKANEMRESKQTTGQQEKSAPVDDWLALARLAQEVDEETPSTDLDVSEDAPQDVQECACGAPFRSSGVCQRGHRSDGRLEHAEHERNAGERLAEAHDALAAALLESWVEWDAARKAGHFSKAVKSGPMPGGVKDSPGRGPTGKLRNFESMSPGKLTETLAALKLHGEDPEAHKAAMVAATHKLGVKFDSDATKIPAELADASSGQLLFVG